MDKTDPEDEMYQGKLNGKLVIYTKDIRASTGNEDGDKTEESNDRTESELDERNETENEEDEWINGDWKNEEEMDKERRTELAG